MPLLRREPDLYPDHLFELSPESEPWSVAHVRSRQEKVLGRHLLRNGIPFFLPVVENVTVRSGRRFRSYTPLFNGYVFFRGANAAPVLWTSGVTASLIRVPDQQQLHDELRQIRELQLAGASLRVCELVPGTPVRVTSGAFRGYTGVVSESRGGSRLIVTLSLLRKGVAVEFESAMLATARG
jgi:transcription antitermination factor NusG